MSKSPINAIVLAISAMIFMLSGCDRPKQAMAPPPPEVVTVTVQPEQVILMTELPGRTSAYRIAEIRPQVNGIIQKRLFKEGSEIGRASCRERV